MPFTRMAIPLRYIATGEGYVSNNDFGDKMPKKDNNKVAGEPDWLDPSNDRKAPYTEEELELFVDGYIKSNEEKWISLVIDVGEHKAREMIKDGFRKIDERSVANMDIDGHLH